MSKVLSDYDLSLLQILVIRKARDLALRGTCKRETLFAGMSIEEQHIVLTLYFSVKSLHSEQISIP